MTIDNKRALEATDAVLIQQAQSNAIKVSFSLPTETVRTIRNLAEKRNQTMTNIVREAISRTQFVQDVIDSGGLLLVEAKDGSTSRVVFS
jgi:predicted transcriptional regulator